jgi:hypothetical protein
MSGGCDPARAKRDGVRLSACSKGKRDPQAIAWGSLLSRSQILVSFRDLAVTRLLVG